MQEPPSAEQRLIQEAIESCPGKTVLSSAAGFAFGGLFGMFMSSIDWQSTTEEFQAKSTREQIKITLKDMGQKSFSNAKNFMLVAAVFSGTECIIESVILDISNPSVQS
jgi:hypothetical protein